MEKLRMKSQDAADSNVAKIASLFPQCVTERLNKDGKPEYAIDFDKLRAELSKDVLDEGEERYQFTWPDKRAASRLANTAIDKTLRPDLEASKDFWSTENLYIEGDNLDVLKVLRENYLGKIKMIYIDPPYNTGNDFVYNDDFAQGKEYFEATSGLYDEDGNQVLDPMQRNTESNGRFHTDWLNMIYPRLKVARDLLSDDGVIFISIGQEEVSTLISICNEILGESNQEGIISRQMKSGGNQGKSFSRNIDYILVYAKCSSNLLPFREPLEEGLKTKVYNQIELNGPRKGEHFRLMGLYQAGLNDWRPNQKYYITAPDGTELLPPCSIQDEVMREGDGRWRWSKQRFLEEFKNGNIRFLETTSSPLVDKYGNKVKWNVYTKIWLSDREQEGRIPIDLITKLENRHSSAELKDLQIPFDFAKPSGLIQKLISFIHDNEDIIVLDFFSGSATTAHAVMKLNAEDGGKRKFIMVQLPEVTDEKSEARKAGYETICQIGEERIRRAGKKIKEEAGLQGQDLDIGFRVLKLDSSNMEDVFYTPEEFSQANLFNSVDNVKPDRTPLDLLFQVMPELDIELSAKIEEKKVNGKNVFFVDGTYLIATFDLDVNESTVTEIAKMRPQYFVMRDTSAANDNVLDNFEQIFRHYSPDTIRKIL